MKEEEKSEGLVEWNADTDFPMGTGDWESDPESEAELDEQPESEETQLPVPDGLGSDDMLPRVDALQKSLEDAKADGKIDDSEVMGLMGQMMEMVSLLVNTKAPRVPKAASDMRSRRARDFDTPDELKKYLHEHPKADKSKHQVKGEGKSKSKDEAKGKSTKKDDKPAIKGRPSKKDVSKDKPAAKGKPTPKGKATPKDKAQKGKSVDNGKVDPKEKEILDKSDPKVVEHFRHDIPEYKLTLIARHDGKLDEADIENVKDIQSKLKWMGDRMKKGIKESADICKMKPPICEGNMGITRDHMPQIMDSSLNEMNKPDDERKAGKDGNTKMFENQAGEKVSFDDLDDKERGKLEKKWEDERTKAKAAIDSGATDLDTPMLKQLMTAVQGEGTKITTGEKIAVGSLKATQSEIKAGKTYGIADAWLKGKIDPKVMENPIIITADNHILDGHHRYSAALTVDPEYQMNVIRIGMPMKEFLMRAHQQPGVFRADIDDNIIPDDKEVDLGDGPTKIKRMSKKKAMVSSIARKIARRSIMAKRLASDCLGEK